ncbi:MAG: HAD-IIIC family phosphatase [Brevundimonas sp.]|nr:MAG: HAD-IIIC family phosphatase [Brevundimonas sp.]
MSTLYWLPEAPDWRDDVRAFSAASAPAWADAVALARARLTFAQTNGLDGAVRTALVAGMVAGAPEPVRVALIGSSTLTHLHPGVRIGGLRHGLRLETFETDFGQHRQALMDRGSALHAFRPDVIVFAFDAPYLARAADPGLSPEEAAAALEAAADDLVQHWSMAREAFGAQVIQQGVLHTAPTVMGSNEHRLPGAAADLLRRLDQRLRASTDAHGVDLMDLAPWIEQDGLKTWHSRGQWLRARQEISLAAGPVWGDLVGRLVAARRGLSSKCLVLDLDNTIWGGVVGDDGLAGLALGPGAGEGEAYQDIQAYAAALAARGVILAVSSKNDETTVVDAFDNHPDMILQRDQIACLRANWEDKPSNLRAIAEALNIGLDSLVFLDDNPVERDLVRRNLPMVVVPEWPGDPALVPRMLSDAGWFESVALTDEDRSKTAQYAARSRSAAMQAGATDLDSYLRDLDMTLSWAPVTQDGLARVVQLINKTNQFNLTTRRYTDEAVRAMLADPDSRVLQFRLTDRFVDNGVVAVAILKRQTDGVVGVDTWLMSCRVLGRKVEQATLGVLVDEAKALGAAVLEGRYLPTERNGMVRNLYADLGFAAAEAEAGVFHLDLTAAPPADVHIAITRAS